MLQSLVSLSPTDLQIFSRNFGGPLVPGRQLSPDPPDLVRAVGAVAVAAGHQHDPIDQLVNVGPLHARRLKHDQYFQLFIEELTKT